MWQLEGHLRTPNPAPGAVGHFEPDDAAKPRHRQACPDRRAERGHVPPDDSRRRNPHYDAAIIALGEGCDDPHVPKHSARKRVLKRSRYEDHEWPGRARAGRLRIPAGSGSRGPRPQVAADRAVRRAELVAIVAAQWHSRAKEAGKQPGAFRSRRPPHVHG